MRVLLVRLDGIGDAAVCTPLVAGLLAAGHEVGAALSTRNAGLFAPGVLAAEHVLERIPWPRHGSTPSSTRRARTEIASMHYDLALVASEEPEAYELARFARVRVGFTTGWARPFKSLWVRAQLTRAVAREAAGGTRHEVEILAQLGEEYTAPGTPWNDAARLRPLLAGAAPPPRSGIMLQAGPKWEAAAPGALRAAVTALRARGLHVVAGPGEEESVREACGVTPSAFDSLRQWVAAIDGAAALVTTDTGAAHVAGMLGVPVVDIFPDAGFETQVRRWRPWAAPYRALPAAALRDGAAAAVIERALDEL